MSYFDIPDNPEFTELIRMFEKTDPGHADLFNNCIRLLLFNEIFLKKSISIHEFNMENPHGVTKEQLGLGNIDPTPDMDKPVSTAQQEAMQGLYTQLTGYTDQAISNLIDGAPNTLDTLKEIAEAIAENENVMEALNNAIGKKANQTELDTHTGNNVVHVTKTERDKWNGMLPKTDNAVSAFKWKIGRNINGMSVDGSENRFNYGSCSTAAETAAKTVACTGFTLAAGAEITVKFTVTNTAASPTLNVNGTGAKPIYYRGKAITAGYLAANRTYDFRYSGTQYELVGDIDTNTTYANVKAATAAGAGKAGLVPAPAAGGQGKYLTGAATWEDVDEHAATFSSGDESDPTGWADIGVVASGEKHNSLWRKFSLAVKNLRYLKKVLGTTDISAIGGGTVTGAISKLNTDLGSKVDTNDSRLSDARTPKDHNHDGRYYTETEINGLIFRGLSIHRQLTVQKWETIALPNDNRKLVEIAVVNGDGTNVANMVISKDAAKFGTSAAPIVLKNGTVATAQFYIKNNNLSLFVYTGYVAWVFM